MTDEEWAATQQGLHGKAMGADPSKPAAAASTEPSYWTQAGRGVLRGVASDVPGLSSSQFATQDDAGPVETGARWAGEAAPFFAPGLDLGLGAKFGAKAASWAYEYGPSIKTLTKVLGPDKARQLVHGLWDTMPKVGRAITQGAIGGVMADPEHPLEGAATGAAAAPVVGAARRGFGTLSPAVKHAAVTIPSAAATTGAMIGAREMAGRGEEWPAYFAARHSMSPLLGLAAAATGRPAAAGGAASGLRKWMSGDEP